MLDTLSHGFSRKPPRSRGSHLTRTRPEAQGSPNPTKKTWKCFWQVFDSSFQSWDLTFSRRSRRPRQRAKPVAYFYAELRVPRGEASVQQTALLFFRDPLP